MIKIGREIRWYNSYQSEIEFSQKHNFDFMQVWFKDGKILIDDLPEPKEQAIKEAGFPVIIHAVFDPYDFDRYEDQLIKILLYLEHDEVIIHMVNEKGISNDIIKELALSRIVRFSEKAKANGITWYLENNSVVDYFNYLPEDLAHIFKNDDYVELLLDVAHIDNYEHLERLIEVKIPKCLHVAGKHFDVAHEHLSLTQGDIDYGLIFKKYLPEYNGRIILEVGGEEKDIIESKHIIDKAISVMN